MHSSPLGKPGTKDTGGMSTYLRELSLALGQMGQRLDLYTAVGSAAPQQTSLGPGVRLVTLPAGSGSEAKLDLYDHLDSFTGGLDQFRRAERQSYDLIFSHYWLSGMVGEKLKSRWGVPHVIMFHTLGAAKNASCSGEREPALRIEAEKALVQDSDKIIVASRREKEALQRYYGAPPGKIELIPCGVNLALFRPLPQRPARQRAGLEDEKTVLFVGRMEPVKGLELLLRAAAILHGQGCSFKLLIAGGDAPDDPAIQHYRKLALEWGIADRLVFPGPVEHYLLPFYYSAADVTVIASHYESFGLTALESLACGTPVVATDVGDLKEIIEQGRTGAVLEERCPEKMAEAVAAFLKLPQKPVQLCRSSVASFGWPGVARQVAAAFGEIIRLKRSRGYGTG